MATAPPPTRCSLIDAGLVAPRCRSSARCGPTGPTVRLAVAEGAIGAARLAGGCAGYVRHPPLEDADAVFERLLAFIRQHGIDVVLPLSDAATAALDRVRGRNSNATSRWQSPARAAAVADTMDKGRTLGVARRVPETFAVPATLEPEGPHAVNLTPPLPSPDRGLPPQRRPLARARHRRGQGPRLAQRPQARPHRHAPPGPRGRGPSELEELTARLMAEVEPMSEIEARLARRLAIAFWKGERAERIEVALFDAAPKPPPQAGFQWEEADPLTTFDLKRFNAVRGYQAQQGREISRCLKELRQLRKDALAECTDETEATLENEPGSPAARQRRRARAGRNGRAGGPGSLAKRT